MNDLDLTRWLLKVRDALAEEDEAKRNRMLRAADTFLRGNNQLLALREIGIDKVRRRESPKKFNPGAVRGRVAREELTAPKRQLLRKEAVRLAPHDSKPVSGALSFGLIWQTVRVQMRQPTAPSVGTGFCCGMCRMRNCTGAQSRLRVRRLTNIPPRLKPSTAPSSAAVNMVLGEASPVPRDNRTALYAMAKVQKARRRYIGFPLEKDCLTNVLASCRIFAPPNANRSGRSNQLLSVPPHPWRCPGCPACEPNFFICSYSISYATSRTVELLLGVLPSSPVAAPRFSGKVLVFSRELFLSQLDPLCEVRTGEYWRLEKLKFFDEVLARRFPESRRKAYYLMSIHEHLPPQARRELKEWDARRDWGWRKWREGRTGVRLCKLAAQGALTAKDQFKQEIEKELTGREPEPWEIIYFRLDKTQIPVVEHAIEAAALMLGTDKWRGYCLEMICRGLPGRSEPRK
jgi:hypothetical protein